MSKRNPERTAGGDRRGLLRRAALAMREEGRRAGWYHGAREGLRIIIPYPWRRRAVLLWRSRFGILPLTAWAHSRAPARPSAPQPGLHRSRAGDFFGGVTLLPHLPAADARAILEAPVDAPPRAGADIICFSIIDWSFRYQRPQQLMAQFASHGHRVFYLNVTQFLSAHARPRFAAREIQENLYEVRVAVQQPLDIFRYVVESNDLKLLLDSLDDLRHVYNINEAIGYVMIPSWARVAIEAQRRWGWRVVYDCMDEWENFPGVQPASLAAETQLVEKCDLLVVTARRLDRKWRGYRRPMVLARNAADYQFYAKHCQPNALLPGVSRPVVGYYGAIADWFDLELLA